MLITKEPMVLILSGPSGAGKGMLVGKLLAADPDFVFSCSVTTRAPRASEQEGRDYHFINDAEYDALIAQDAFLERATVHGNRYGTLKAPFEQARRDGKHMLLDVDTQGALALIEKLDHPVSVFVTPPSFTVLRQRLESRHTNDPADIEHRMANARVEVTRMDRYQYALINDDADVAFAQLQTIIAVEKLRTIRYHLTVEA